MSVEVDGIRQMHHGSRIYSDVNAVALGRIASKAFAGRDWHKLNPKEKKLVEALENAGYIKVNIPSTGFVGKIL